MTYEDVLHWWKGKDLNTYVDYVQMLDNFRIVFACNSSNIEGAHLTYHSTRDIFENSPVYDVIPSEVVEVQNQRLVFTGLMKKLVAKEELSVQFILAVHNRLLQGLYDEVRWDKGERPGKFKVHDYCVGVMDVGTEPERVLSEIQELLEEVSEVTSDPLMVSTYFHARFETIHPFAEGNGRVGRVLMNYLLMLRGYPPTVIFNEDKDTYYLALEVYNRTEELSGFVQFIKEQTIKTWINRITPTKPKKDLRSLVPELYKNLSDEELQIRFGHII